MKLIDLLVQELPKRGGWPDGADCCCLSGADSDGVTIQFRFIPRDNNFLFTPDADHLDIPYEGDATEFITCGVITKDMYQSALAASQKPAWNGEGLPPVGCECEVSVDGGRSWCTYRAISEKNGVRLIEIGNLTEEFQNNNWIFRPLRTEAERKRDAAAEAIHRYMPECIPDTPNEFYHAKKIYDAIAAGKIPGVKLDD